MSTNYKSKIMSFATAALVTMTCSTQLAVNKVHAATIGQELLVTEVMPMSETSGDSYEYIEVYNNSDGNIDIKDYKLPLQNMDITTSKVIAPKGILVVSIKGSTTLENFNTFYGTALTQDKYLNLPFVNEILSNTSNEDILLSKDDGTVISRAHYSPSDFMLKKSVTFKYAQSGFDMVLLGQKQNPTPGNVSSEQVPQSGVRVTDVSIDKPVLTMEVNKTSMLYATVAPATAADKSVVWNSDNTDVAVVNSKGVVTSKAEGIAKITVTTVDGGFTATCIVVVSRVPATGISLDKTAASIDVGKAMILTASVTPINATNKSVSWNSSNSSVASVDSNGVVIGKSAGYAVISAVTVDGNYTASCRVQVNAVNAVVPVTGITISKKNITLKKGNAVIVESQITPSNATNKKVAWKSSDETIASVDINQGVVFAKQSGVVVITATTADGGYRDYCYVTVTNDSTINVPVTSVQLSTEVVLMNKDESEILTATVLPEKATNKSVTWSSSDSKIASVDNTGKVTALKQGVAIVTVKTVDGELKDRCFIIVRDEEDIISKVFRLRLNKTSIRIEEGKQEKLSVVGIPGYMKKTNLTWESDNDNVAFVTQDGRVHGISGGTAKITVQTKDGKYSATCQVIVSGDKGHSNGNGKGKGHSKWWDWED